MSAIATEIHKIDIALSKFHKTNLFNSGLRLFQALDYPVFPLKSAINQEIHEFIYLTLKRKILFNIDEQNHLNIINSISLLFSINADLFSAKKIKDNSFNQIIFLAVDLNTSTRDRSINAHTITKILNKMFSYQIFILFYHDDQVLFSGLVYENIGVEQSGKVFLSDWYSCFETDNESILKLSSLSFWYHSQKNLKDFYYDIIYSISREYYIYPESHEYITYGCLENEFKNSPINGLGVQQSFQSIKDLAIENSKYYQNKYKDDFVDNNEKIDLLIIDNDLLLIDTDDYSNNEVDSDIDEFDEKYNESLEEVDETIFEDPLKMLEWLENGDD
jgi:hypothetical protein